MGEKMDELTMFLFESLMGRNSLSDSLSANDQLIVGDGTPITLQISCTEFPPNSIRDEVIVVIVGGIAADCRHITPQIHCDNY